MGGTPTDRLLLGGELVNWSQGSANARGQGLPTTTRTNVTPVALLFPRPNRRLFLKLGVGFAFAGQDSPVAGNFRGVGGSVGVGWQITNRRRTLPVSVEATGQAYNEAGRSRQLGLLVVTIGWGWR